jgi:4-amino-4-deoxy-L-arabinose transferase-like glycosyltransferase
MKPFRLLTIAVFAAATVPRLAHRGMFVDGVTYASIARNLALGRGSFWEPFYTATIYPQVHEHPPFGFWLQSLWFRVLGDHLFVERAYSVVVAIATAAVVIAIWRRLHADVPPGDGRDVEPWGAGQRRLEWLPVLLWIAVPVVSWAIVGNLLDTTVALFTTTATLAALQGVGATTPGRAIACGALSGLSIVAATLTKGPVGLFPLVAPLTFFLLPRARRIFGALAAQWATVASCAVALLAFGISRASLTAYVNQQVLAAMSGQREVSAGSFTILGQLVQGVMLPLAGMGVLAIAAARRFVAPSRLARRYAASFVLLGLAGTLPILASAKQAGHYLVPAVSLYAMAGALVLAPTVTVFTERYARPGSRWVGLVSLFVIAGTVGAAYAPALGRDRVRLANLDVLAPTIPRSVTAGICPDANGDWGLHAWFQRRFRVSLDAADAGGHDWFVASTGAGPTCRPAQCSAVTDPAQEIVLMKCVRSD